MASPLNAKICIAKCAKTKNTFGIRLEQRGSVWVMTWAFKIDERTAKHEGFDDTITGSIQNSAEYPGCPYCGNKAFVQCHCGKCGCSIGSGYFTCPWCGDSFEPRFGDVFTLKTGDY
jgi:hypothetical protein